MYLPPVTLIVLNWNGRDLLEACLAALTALDYPDFTIILADNDSSDDSVAFVQATFPQVAILPTGGNLGYAGGNNVALRGVQTAWAAIVNPDVLLPPDWLKKMMMAISAEPPTPPIGIAGCTLTYPDGNLQHTGGRIQLPRGLPSQVDPDAPTNGVVDVGYATGAALLVRRDCWQAIGLLDEGFFMYFEEVDWCARAQRAGWRVVVVADAVAIHDESALAGKTNATYLQRFHTGRWRCLLKQTPCNVLLEETVAAEAAWLATLGPAARGALATVYRNTLLGLPDILRARVRDGGDEISAETRALQLGLTHLYQTAKLGPEPDWATKSKAATVTEQPFQSSLPLVAKARAAWASIAAKWYVRPLTAQQNQANQALLAELRSSEDRMRQQTAIWLAQDGVSAEMATQQAELQAELAELSRLIGEMETRLGREHS